MQAGQGNVVVAMSPCVSILDVDDPHRYNVTQLIPLVAQVAMEFSTIYLEVDYKQSKLDDDTLVLIITLLLLTNFSCFHY